MRLYTLISLSCKSNTNLFLSFIFLGPKANDINQIEKVGSYVGLVIFFKLHCEAYKKYVNMIDTLKTNGTNSFM